MKIIPAFNFDDANYLSNFFGTILLVTELSPIVHYYVFVILAIS